MISIPYTYIAISFCLLVGFFKVGELDEEIGWGLGLGAGVLALVLNHFFIGGYFGLGLHAVGGFVLLTIYKIIKAMPSKTGKNDDIEHGDSRDGQGRP
jgi:hypothetical protein